MTQIVLSNSLQSYLVQINTFPLLSADEEVKLAVRFKKQNDLDAAEKLVTSNLRFVVKIALEYRNYGFRLSDLIQEGNIGLMKAVKKFDPYKGYRLITYAVWWIRSYIQAFIIKNWSLVHKGVSALKKKLFYQVNKSKERLLRLEHHGLPSGFDRIEQDTHCADGSDTEYRDLSLDKEIGEETTYLDMLPDTSENHEDKIARVQEQGILQAAVAHALQTLHEKERYVIENRLMHEPPLTLQEIGDRLGISRERVRQIEHQALKKLKKSKKLQLLAQQTANL